MIRFTRGDIFSAKAQALVDPVNCAGVPGAGLAKVFRTKYPRATREYVEACRRGELRPGQVLVTPSYRTHNNALVFFPTKNHWRDPSQIEYVHMGLQALRAAMTLPRPEMLLPDGIRSIAMPALGCGLGELSWADVRREIDAALHDLAVDREVLVFEPHGGA